MLRRKENGYRNSWMLKNHNFSIIPTVFTNTMLNSTSKAESLNSVKNSDVADTNGVEFRIELQMKIFRNE